MGFKGWKTLMLATCTGVLAFAGAARANDVWYAAFQTAYPAAVGSRIDSCLICHTTAAVTTSTARNPYGAAYRTAGHSFTAIALADSDGDGLTNQAEIAAFTFPGNAADPAVATLPTVAIAATDAIATEAGLTTGQYTVTRTGATTAALTVNYTVAGTATAGSDYVTLARSVQLAAGAATATITVTPIDDLLVEPDETVVVTLGANAAYTVGAAASATVTIQSDEVTPLPTVTIAATDAIATVAGLTTGQYTVTRTGATTAALTVNYTVAGTATAGSDYVTLAGSVQIPAGAATATITVTPLDDLLVEPDETVVVTLGANAAYLVGPATSATVTIQSDDVAALMTLTVATTNPLSGMSITVSPNDTGNAGNGTTPFTRTYVGGVQVTLTAASTFGGAGFSGWSGCTSVSGATCLVTMDISRTVTANYSASSAYVLWTRGDTGQAALWKVSPGLGANGVVPITSGKHLYSSSGVGAPWEAASYQQVSATEGYVLWTRRDTGQAILWQVDPSAAANEIPITSWSYLYSSSGVGGSWEATSYQHVSANEGYVLWTRRDTGQAILWKVDPSAGAATHVIPISSWSYLYSSSGVGGPWEATSYRHVSATEGYVLWTRSDTGGAGLWKIDPGAAGGTLPVTAYYYSVPGVGGQWQATSYRHVSATEGYLLWTNRDTGLAILWQIDPSVSTRANPFTGWAYLYSSSGVGGPWHATDYIVSGVNGIAAADAAVPVVFADVQTGLNVLKSGSGAGTIGFGGVTCGPACAAVALPYAAREVVVVTAAAGSWFAGWETTDGVAIDILQAKPGETVHAVFARQ